MERYSEKSTSQCDGDSMGNILVWYSNTERAGIVNMTLAESFPDNMPFWMPLPKRPKGNE